MSAATVAGALAMVERNFMIYRRSITPLLSAMVEPVLYLVAIGFGVGALVGTVPGVPVRYAAWVAPAILATTAMNTAFNQTSFGVFGRIRIERTYEAILPTPLSVADIVYGEIASAVINAVLTSVGFVLVMLMTGLDTSPAVLLAIPASVPVGFGFAAAGLAVTGFLRDFADFQYIQLVMLPLYQSIQLIREPALGALSWRAAVPLGYLLLLGVLATRLAIRRMSRLMLK